MKDFSSFSKNDRFCDLCKAVQYCTLCPRLSHKSKILTEQNGNIHSKVIFVAEAPGRLGADRTGIPLYGDRTGDIFNSLISNISWKREDIFITNAILCNPKDKNGNNSTPTKVEISSCSIFLEMIIQIIQPEIIVPLGLVALESLKVLSPHHVKLKDNVGKLIAWNGRYVFPLYHPGPRALIHRSLAKQRADYIILSKHADPLKGLKQRKNKNRFSRQDKEIARTPLQKIVSIFINRFKDISLFKLTKLIYLTDIIALKELGKTLTGEIYMRQQEGPWLPNLSKSINAIKDQDITFYYKKKIPYLSIGPTHSPNVYLSEDSFPVILKSLEKYGKMNNSEIKTAAYLSDPMKYILKQEKAGRDMRKIPVIYKDKTAKELDKE